MNPDTLCLLKKNINDLIIFIFAECYRDFFHIDILYIHSNKNIKKNCSQAKRLLWNRTLTIRAIQEVKYLFLALIFGMNIFIFLIFIHINILIHVLENTFFFYHAIKMSF